MQKTIVKYSEIWKLSLPIIAGSAIENIINIIDTAFLGRVNEIALGAVAIGGIFYLAFIMIAWGFGIGAQIIISRRFGEGNHQQIGKTFQHAAYFLLPVGMIFLVGILLGEKYFFKTFLKSESINLAVNQFLSIRIWGILFSYCNILLRSFFIGTLRTRIIGYGSALVAVVTISLDYILIFGHFGFKPLGIAGAAWASIMAELVATIFFFIYFIKTVNFSTFGLVKIHKFDASHLKQVLHTAAPVMFQFFISFTGWFLFFLLIEHIGEVPLAVSNIVRSLYMIILLPLWGYSSACSTLVSYKIGRQETSDVVPLIFRITSLSLLSVFAMVLICNLFSGVILHFYTNDPILIENSKPVLNVASISALLLAIAFILLNGVSGAGKTRVTLLFESIVMSAYITWIVVLVETGVKNVALVWCAEILYGVLMGIMSGLYIKFGKWKRTKV
jgi:putative MATE family efflux protein